MDTFRNIGFLFRRHTAVMAMNLAGLILAFCAFIAIMEKVQYENSFDSFYPESDRIFRVDQKEVSGIFRSVLPAGFSDAVINSSAHIAAGALYCPFVGEQYIAVRDSLGQEHGFRMQANNASGGIFDVFGITVTEGDRNALYEPDKIAIPESMARKMFGNAPAVGQHVEIRSGSGFITGTDWTIGAVYKDIPGNSQIRNSLLLPVPDFFMQNFGASNFLCWLRLDDASHATQVASDFNSSFDFSVNSHLSGITLVPVKDIYYLEEGNDARVFRSGSRSWTGILTAVAVLILLTGTFNYTNFYTAMIPARLRNINTRKVFGASDRSIRTGLLAETVSVSLLACLTASAVMSGIYGKMPDIHLILTCTGAAMAAGLISGIYPGSFATSFQPAMALKGNCGIPSKGKALKTTLIALQFAVSAGLVIFVIFTYQQNRLMLTYSPGFDRDRLAVVELTSGIVKGNGETFRSEARKYAGIEDVAFAMETIGSQEVYSTETMEWKGQEIQTFQLYCSSNFLDVTGIPIVEGNGFTDSDAGNVIMNISARDAYGMECGPLPGWDSEIKGFCADARFSSLRQDSMPICFTCIPPEYGYTPVAYVRMAEDADRKEVAGHLEDIIAKIDPAFPVEVKFYDQILSDVYSKEMEFSRVLVLFSILAAVLALTGVFSMVIFDTQYQKKEIALKKVLGARLADILWQGNRRYLTIASASFLIAAPLSWYAVELWLRGFAEKTGFRLWVFAAALAMNTVLTALTVSSVYFKAACTDPARTLREE